MEEDQKPVKTSTIDWFLSDISNAEIQITEELRSAMIHHAREFLAAGGQISWERWSMLGSASREAFVEAAAELRVRSALEAK